jgi:purine-cytosine permease-like protein
MEKHKMAFRLKWLLIMAFAIGYFGLAGLSSAFAMPVNPAVGEMAMDNCHDGAHCCVSVACSTCATCVGYAVPGTFPYPAKPQTVHASRAPDSLFSVTETVDPPPPRR